MKTLRIKSVALIAMIIALFTPFAASAKTTVTGGPFTNLPTTGQVITLKLSGYPSNAGFYLLQCLSNNDNARPHICNPNNQLWISTSPGANFAPTADIQFRPTATFTYGSTGVDCIKARCELFMRLDHMASGDRTEDQYIPLTFVGSSTPSPTADVITAYIGEKRLKSMTNISVRYQDVVTINATARSGASLTYSSTSNTCAVAGNRVTFTQGSGICDVAITSPGNAQFTAVTEHFLFRINPGVQRITLNTAVRVGTSFMLPTLTNFGEKISYEKSTTTNCTLIGTTIYFNKVGACLIKATALAKTNTYQSMNQTIVFKIRK